MGKDKVTITQVAQQAEVSLATASRALNETGSGGPVSEDARQRVLKAARDLGYVPPRARHRKYIQPTKTLGCVVPDLANPFFAELAQSVVDAAGAEGYDVLLAVSTDRENRHNEPKAVQTLLKHSVDGIIAVPVGSKDETAIWQQVLDAGIKLVFVDRNLDRVLRDVDTVTVDNKKGAHDAVWHLFTNGHTRIGLLTGPLSASTLSARRDGFIQAHDEAHIQLDENLIQNCTFEEESRNQAARNLLALRPVPTGVLASGNLLAESMLIAMQEAGVDKAWMGSAMQMTEDDDRNCPLGISLIMFDDIHWARLTTPQLTTIAHPPRKLGATAVRTILQRLNHGTPPNHPILQLATLTVRNSVYDIRPQPVATLTVPK